MSKFLPWGECKVPAWFVAPLIGAGIGLVGGYVVDHYLGDGEYSAGEAAFDAAGGALGGSLAKPVTTVGGRVFTIGRAHFSKSTSFSFADDAIGTTAAIASGNVKPIGIAVTTSYFGDQYTHAHQSSDVGRASEGTVASGGTKKFAEHGGYRPFHGKSQKGWKVGRKGPCRKGYVLSKLDGNWFCVKRA